MRTVLLVGAFLACGAAVAAPALRSAPLDVRQMQLLGKYLEHATDPADLGTGGGATAQTLAFLGREDLVMHSGIFQHGRNDCVPLLESGVLVDPVVYVARLAPGYRVTMVNEAHDMPQGRAFNGAIAVALRSQGYRWYGAEAFDSGIGADAPAWPLLTDGIYVGEPVYGRLVRALRGLGYHLFAYEIQGAPDTSLSMQAQIDHREVGQAVNLAAKIATMPAQEKILVHVGYGHLLKIALRDAPAEMMATRFREKTGIDPLTVDQTTYWSRDNHYAVCDPAALHTADPGMVYLAAPRPSFTRGRPDWRLAFGDRFADIPAGLRRPGEAAIYEARAESEPDTAVPLDRLLLRPGENLPLLLPPGRYRVTVWTAKTGWSAAIPLSVGGKS